MTQLTSKVAKSEPKNTLATFAKVSSRSLGRINFWLELEIPRKYFDENSRKQFGIKRGREKKMLCHRSVSQKSETNLISKHQSSQKVKIMLRIKDPSKEQFADCYC